MTPEQYLALPEEKPYLEYVDGVVLQKPMPSDIHGFIVVRLGYFLTAWIGAGGGAVGAEIRSRLGDPPNFRLPDLSYFKPGAPRGQSPPTLAVEVLSESQTLGELQRKCELLRASGVEACWLIDPFSRSALLYEGRRKAVRIETLKAECVPGFELPLSGLFAILD